MNAKYQPKKPYVKPVQESAKPMSEENTQAPVAEDLSKEPEASEVTASATAPAAEPATETQEKEPEASEVIASVTTPAPVVKPTVVNTVAAPTAKPATTAESSMENVFQKMRENGTVFEKMTMADRKSVV